MPQRDLTGFFGFSECLEWRADDLNGRHVFMDGTPRSYKANIAPKTWTAGARIADDKRKVVATRIPYFDVFDWSHNTTELHATPQKVAPVRSSHGLRPLCDGGFAKSPRSAYFGCMFKPFEF